jgi:hypothetical protein
MFIVKYRDNRDVFKWVWTYKGWSQESHIALGYQKIKTWKTHKGATKFIENLKKRGLMSSAKIYVDRI